MRKSAFDDLPSWLIYYSHVTVIQQPQSRQVHWLSMNLASCQLDLSDQQMCQSLWWLYNGGESIPQRLSVDVFQCFSVRHISLYSCRCALYVSACLCLERGRRSVMQSANWHQNVKYTLQSTSTFCSCYNFVARSYRPVCLSFRWCSGQQRRYYQHQYLQRCW